MKSFHNPQKSNTTHIGVATPELKTTVIEKWYIRGCSLRVLLEIITVIVVWKGIQSRSETNRTRAEGLFFYYLRLLYCLDQMLVVMLLSQHQVSSKSLIVICKSCWINLIIYSFLFLRHQWMSSGWWQQLFAKC